MILPVLNQTERFAPLISYTAKTQIEFEASCTALLVIQNDTIVTEWYTGRHHDKAGALPVGQHSQFNIYSIRKTYIGLALSLAMIEADMRDWDAPARQFINDIPSEELGSLTLRQLATKRGPKFSGASRIEREALIGKVVQTLSGLSIAELIGQRIIDPLGWTHTEWAVAPKASFVCDFTAKDGYPSVRIESEEGHERNLYVNARELAYWGYLHLKKGHVDGKQLVPREAFDMTFSLQSDEAGGKAILGWYLENGFSHASGYTGCHVAVMPEHEAVAVRMYNQWNLPDAGKREDYDDEVAAFHRIFRSCLERAQLGRDAV